MKRTLAIVLAVVMCIALVACGAAAGGPNGTYACSMEGMELMSITLDGGKATVSSFGESMDGTYTLNGNTLTITIDGEPMDFAWNAASNSFSADIEGMSLTFTKK